MKLCTFTVLKISSPLANIPQPLQQTISFILFLDHVPCSGLHQLLSQPSVVCKNVTKLQNWIRTGWNTICTFYAENLINYQGVTLEISSKTSFITQIRNDDGEATVKTKWFQEGSGKRSWEGEWWAQCGRCEVSGIFWNPTFQVKTQFKMLTGTNKYKKIL